MCYATVKIMESLFSDYLTDIMKFLGTAAIGITLKITVSQLYLIESQDLVSVTRKLDSRIIMTVRSP